MLKQHLFVLLTLGALFCALTSFYSGNPHSRHPTQKLALRTIIIDPGHGGFDPGTSGLFSKEKDVALAI